MAELITKICTSCLVDTFIVEFSKSRPTLCKDCVRNASRMYDQQHLLKRRETKRRSYYKNRQKVLERISRYGKTEAVRNKYYKKQYGISLAEYEALSRKQRGLCLICSTPQEKQPTKMTVDHCHLTGNIRGLLCRDCNVGLGCFKDNPTSLRKAASYLSRSTDRPSPREHSNKVTLHAPDVAPQATS